MKTQHTPGPWHRNINAKYPVFAGEAPNHIHIASIMIGAPVAEREANLRLIAAAPDLLAALIRMREDWLTAFEADVTEGDKDACEILAAVDTAIAKTHYFVRS